MAKDRSLVRASDIGAWTYCGRSWWLAHVQGVPHRDPQALARGTAQHTAHGRQVVQSRRLIWLGTVLVVLALLAAAALIVGWLL